MNRIHLLIILVGSWIHLLIILGYHPMIFSPRTRNRRSQCSISWEIRLAGCEVEAGAQKWWNMMKPSSFWWKMGILSGDLSGDHGETSPWILVKTHTRCGVNMNIPAEVMWTTGASKLLTTHLGSWSIQHQGYTPGILLAWWSFRGYPSL
jgi:hypothetical protein